MKSGKSKSVGYPFGMRRMDTMRGKELAPKSLRRVGKYYLSECTDRQLILAGVKAEENES